MSRFAAFGSGGNDGFRQMLIFFQAFRKIIPVNISLADGKASPNAVFAGSVPYLMLAGNVVAGWQMARALIVAEDQRAEDAAFMDAKVATARFYAEHILSKVPGVRDSIIEGHAAVNDMALEAF